MEPRLFADRVQHRELIGRELDLLGDEAVFAPRFILGRNRQRVEKIWPIPAAGTPLMTKGLSVSKVPIAASRIVPPFGASGLTYSKCLKSGPYFRSPNNDMPGVVIAAAARRGQP